MNLGDHQNIALFGGTFDPVHNGHVAVARYVLDQCKIPSILFIPAPSPPHKPPPKASFHHRVAMLEHALTNEPGMHVSLIESEYAGPSYTITTIKMLQEKYGQARLYLIIGADSLVDLPIWYHSEELLKAANFIAVGRENADNEKIARAIDSFAVQFTYDADKKNYSSAYGTSITYLDKFKWTASSSAVRKQLLLGQKPTVLTRSVYDYIVQNNLYSPGKQS